MLGEDEGDEAVVGNKRSRTPRLTLKETHLLSNKGLWALYQQSQTLQLSRKDGQQANDMATVMGAYRDWAHKLFPKMHSSDVLDRFTKWSGKSVIKSALATMRIDMEVARAQGQVVDEAKYQSVS